MDIEKFTKSLGSLKVGDSYKMSEYIRGHSNEAVRRNPRNIPVLFRKAHCITVEGPLNGRTYTRAHPSGELCQECPLYDNCTIR
jgi:hypothetical protein